MKLDLTFQLPQSMNDYNEVPEDGYAEDNIDNAGDPEGGEGGQAPKDAIPAEEKITTKFLTKYERGKEPNQNFRKR